MSTIVYQGVHSYFESRLIETTTVKLNVATCMAGQETKEECHIKETNYNKPTNLEFSDWSSIQPLSNVYIQKETTHKQSLYIHPLTKTSPRLSQKSLELCTENLGSETGSDSMDNNIISLYSSDNSKSTRTPFFENDQKVPKQIKSRGHKASNFPPPLTTMRSPNSIQVRPYREDGRLIIESFETPSGNTQLQAERSNGRLTLSFVIASANNLNFEKTNEDSETYEIEKKEHETNQDGYEDKEFNMSKSKNLDEMAKENIQRRGRCKENQHGNKNSCFWTKPLCVATS